MNNSYNGEERRKYNEGNIISEIKNIKSNCVLERSTIEKLCNKLDIMAEKFSSFSSVIEKIVVRHDERIASIMQNQKNVEDYIEELNKSIKTIEQIIVQHDQRIISCEKESENNKNTIKDIVKYKWVFVGAVIVLALIFKNSNGIINAMKVIGL